VSSHDKEYIDKFQKEVENTPENREQLARLIVEHWDMKDLVAFAEARLVDTWDPKLHPEDASLYWTEDVDMNREELEGRLNPST
tara:strand:- start:1880 stop:2131 length:252 start_codon:yes stop_codon:yes gene_type:complete